MGYEILGYNKISKTFKSHSGYEADVIIKYDDGFEYYLYKRNRSEFVVKLSKDWITTSNNLGEIIYLDSLDTLLIPHPGASHGLIKANGLTDGDKDVFKIIISSKDSGQYFLEYDIQNHSFSAAGNRVY